MCILACGSRPPVDRRQTAFGLPRPILLLIIVLMVSMSTEAGDRSRRVSQSDSAIHWGHDLELALEQAQKSDRPIVLAFGAVLCPACRKLRAKTIPRPEIQAMADDFIWVSIDIDRNVSLAREWQVTATPTIFLLDSSGRPLKRIVGEVTADELVTQLRRAAAADATEGGDTDQIEVFRHTLLTVGPNGFRGRSVCFSHVGYGPLSLRSQSPFQSLRLGLLPRTPSTIARGQHQLRVDVAWANTWANDHGTFDPAGGDLGLYLLDFESLDVGIAWAYGLRDTIQIELELEQRRHFGGVLDGFIESFHDLFGISQAGRDLFPRDQTNIWIDFFDDRPPIALLGPDAAGTVSRSLLATFQHNVTCGTATWPALAWAVTLRSSLGNPSGLEGDTFDIGLSAAAARRFGDLHVYLTFGFAWYGSDSVHGIDLKSTQASLLAAAEWRFAPRMSLLLQYLATDGVATDLGVFSETSHEIVLGWKWEVVDAGVVEVGLIENIIEFNNSPDFGVHVGWTQRF